MLIQQINALIQGHLWALPHDRLEVLADYILFNVEGMKQANIEARTRKNMTRQSGAIAVIPVNGVLFQKENWVSEYLGWSTVQGLTAQLREAANNSEVGTVLMDFDCPGGEVTGIDELAAEIYDTRQKKQIVAVSNPLMASAAYYLGSNAHKVYVTPTGDVGSIGVYAVHIEYSKAMEDAGIKATMIKAGPYKAEGNPYEPLTEEAKAARQEDIDEHYNMFIRAVARGRNVSQATVKESFGKGRTMMAKKAQQAGMVDGVMTFEQVLESLGVVAESGGRVRADDSLENSDTKLTDDEKRRLALDLFNFS